MVTGDTVGCYQLSVVRAFLWWCVHNLPLSRSHLLGSLFYYVPVYPPGVSCSCKYNHVHFYFSLCKRKVAYDVRYPTLGLLPLSTYIGDRSVSAQRSLPRSFLWMRSTLSSRCIIVITNFCHVYNSQYLGPLI